MRRTANGRSIRVMPGHTGLPNQVIPPQPPQVPQKNMNRPVPVQQCWKLQP